MGYRGEAPTFSPSQQPGPDALPQALPRDLTGQTHPRMPGGGGRGPRGVFYKKLRNCHQQSCLLMFQNPNIHE